MCNTRLNSVCFSVCVCVCQCMRAACVPASECVCACRSVRACRVRVWCVCVVCAAAVRVWPVSVCVCVRASKRFTLRVQAQGEQLTASSESSCSYLAQLYTLIRVLCDRRSSKGVIGHRLRRPVSTITYRVFASLCTVFGGAPVITCTLYSCADASF